LKQQVSKSPLAKNRYIVPSLSRAIRVLELLADEPSGLTLSELTGQTDIPKSSLFRILATLEHSGCVQLAESTKRYRMGLKLWELGSAYIEHSDLDSAATPHMEELAQACGESVFLGMLDGTDVVYVRRIESPRSITVVRKLGHRAPIYCTATGEAMLAFLPDAQANEIVENLRLEAHTPQTNTSRRELRRRLEVIRKDGVAVVDGEFNPRLLCVAAPVFGSAGVVQAAITVAMLSAQATDDQVIEAKDRVRQAARSVSRDIGYLGQRAVLGSVEHSAGTS
jgi:DNA-binding IclR family transcriptional regulator